MAYDEINKDLPFDQRIKSEVELACDSINKSYKEMCSTIHKDWDAFYMHYRDLNPPKSEPYIGCANHSVDITSSMIDGLTPRLNEDLWDYNEPVEMQALDTDDVDNVLAVKANKLLSWDIESHEDLREQMWYFTENAEIYNTSFMYTFWESEKDYEEVLKPLLIVNGQPAFEEDGKTPKPFTDQDVKVLQQQGMQVEIQEILVKVFHYVKYSPKSVCIDNKNIVWSDDAESLEDAFKTGFVAIKVYHTLDEIFRILRQQDNSLFETLRDIGKKEFENKYGKNQYQEFSKTERKIWKSKKVEFWLNFTHMDIDDDGIEEPVVMLLYLPDSKLIGMEKYDYLHKQCPVVAGKIKPLHNKIPGIGIAEMNYSDKIYLDSMRNIMADNRTDAAHPVRTYTKLSGFDPAIHSREYGANWELTNLGSQFMQVEQVEPLNHADMWKEFKEVKAEKRERIGMSDMAFGSMPDQQMTYRGMIQLLEESSKSRSMFKKWMAQSIQKIMYQRWKLYCQFWGKAARENDEQVNEWIGKILMGAGNSKKNPMSISILDALDHNFKLVLKATNEDKKIKRLEARDRFEFLAPYLADKPFHLRKLIVATLTAMGDKDPQSWYPSEEEIQQQMVAIQKQAMMELEAEKAKQDEEQRVVELEKEEFNKELGRQEVKQGLQEASGVTRQ